MEMDQKRRLLEVFVAIIIFKFTKCFSNRNHFGVKKYMDIRSTRSCIFLPSCLNLPCFLLQSLYTLPQTLHPIGHLYPEGLFNLALVQHGEGGTGDGTGELAAVAGLHVAGGLAAEELYHLGEVVPGADAFVTEMINAGFAVRRFRVKPGMTVIFQYHGYGFCQVEGVGGGADLVEDYLELGFGGGEAEHCLAEVLAEFAVEPGGADNHVVAAGLLDFLLPVEFGEAIDSGGGAPLVFAAGGVVGFPAEDVVGGDVHQQAADLFHCDGKVLGGGGVERLHKGVFLGSLGPIDVGPGGTVDGGVDVVLLDVLPYGIEVGDVELFIAVTDVGEEVFVGAAAGYELHFVSELTIGSCYKYVHCLTDSG